MSNKDTNKRHIEIFKKDIHKLSYEESISELETILNNVQDENISLDQIQINYIKGIYSLNIARNFYNVWNKRLTILIQNF